MLIYPVRHHSPAAALQLERLIRERRPKAVLVEGPSDADSLIPLLLDPATVPPVAIYAYRGGDDVRASYYPFCRYSPEYVALRAGQAVGARLEFCDLPATAMLDWRDQPDDGLAPPEPAAESTDAAPPEAGYEQFIAALVEAAGFDTFEQLWEAAFEQEVGHGSPDHYVAVLADYGGKVRGLQRTERDAHDDLRERFMAARAHALLANGLPSSDLLLVCGAAHAAAIRAHLERWGEAAPLPPTRGKGSGDGGEAPPAELALIPFSFPRLSEQSGYGAGNRAPWFYQQVWDLGGNYAAATRHALVTLARHLRGQGHNASVAECIDAANLARTLATLRGKLAPGVDELAEAAVACFGQGQPARVEAALRQVLIGDAVGAVTPRVGRTPLQVEFYATARRLGLPIVDAPREVLVHMVVPREAEQSVFLQRLATAEVPYAQEIVSGLGGRGQAAHGGPLEQLARVREKWKLQWTPATDARLVERTAWGSTLAEVCGRLLRQQLDAATRIDAGTAVLLRLALCDLADAIPPALERCDALAADSTSFPALARATYHLDGLLTYGSARALPTERLGELTARLFARAVAHLPSATICGDDAATEVRETLIALHELVRRQSPPAADAATFWESVETVAKADGSHPGLRGLTLVLLELDGRLAEGELAARLSFWLSATAEAADNARLVAGLFALHRGTLVRNRALIGAVTDFLLGLELEQLIPLLPVLRSSLGDLSNAERAYLADTLARLLGLSGPEAGRALSLAPTDEAWLREADAAVAATLAAWKEQYGI